MTVFNIVVSQEEDSSVKELRKLLPLTIRAIAADTLAELFNNLADIDPIVATSASKLAEEYRQKLEQAKADDPAQGSHRTT